MTNMFVPLNTKIDAMSTMFLTNKDYNALLDCETSLDQLEYLKTTKAYCNYITVSDFLSDIELELIRAMTIRTEKLRYFLFNKYKEFYRDLLSRYYIEDLKTILRTIVRREDFSDLKNRLRTNFNIKHITSQTTLKEFVDSLDPPYHDILENYIDENYDRILFFMEMNLDRLYYQRLMRSAKKLRKRDRKIVEDYYGDWIDLLNIEWIYRAIKYYNVPREVIFNVTILGGNEFKIASLKEMSYYDLSSLIHMLTQTKYEFLVVSEHDIDLYMSRRVDRYLYYRARKYMKSAAFDISKLIAYVELSEFEIHDITKTMETKRFNLNKALAETYLIRNIERK